MHDCINVCGVQSNIKKSGYHSDKNSASASPVLSAVWKRDRYFVMRVQKYLQNDTNRNRCAQMLPLSVVMFKRERKRVRVVMCLNCEIIM